MTLIVIAKAAQTMVHNVKPVLNIAVLQAIVQIIVQADNTMMEIVIVKVAPLNTEANAKLVQNPLVQQAIAQIHAQAVNIETKTIVLAKIVLFLAKTVYHATIRNA